MVTENNFSKFRVFLHHKKIELYGLIYYIMNDSDSIDYNRIAAAIDYISNNFKEQPSLEDIAEKVHLSPFHFQKIFKAWAGTTPKKFLQYVSTQHAKKLLLEERATLFEAAYDTGLSGTGRLHDLFINIEGMTPAEYKHGGRNLSISYSFAMSPFGTIIVASTAKGICYLAFEDDRAKAIADLAAQFPNALLQMRTDDLQQSAIAIFRSDWANPSEIKLHLKGTDFQLKVWEALLKIPFGCLSSYASIAERIASPKASRAVGTAIGSNPVAFLIPCHRVIKSTGTFGGYMWGSTRKTAIIGWEAGQLQVDEI